MAKRIPLDLELAVTVGTTATGANVHEILRLWSAYVEYCAAGRKDMVKATAHNLRKLLVKNAASLQEIRKGTAA